jgi:hypothetical protein
MNDHASTVDVPKNPNQLPIGLTDFMGSIGIKGGQVVLMDVITHEELPAIPEMNMEWLRLSSIEEWMESQGQNLPDRIWVNVSHFDKDYVFNMKTGMPVDLNIVVRENETITDFAVCKDPKVGRKGTKHARFSVGGHGGEEPMTTGDIENAIDYDEDERFKPENWDPSREESYKYDVEWQRMREICIEEHAIVPLYTLVGHESRNWKNLTVDFKGPTIIKKVYADGTILDEVVEDTPAIVARIVEDFADKERVDSVIFISEKHSLESPPCRIVGEDKNLSLEIYLAATEDEEVEKEVLHRLDGEVTLREIAEA